MRIEAKNLVKIYGDRSVVNYVSFNINKGEVFCLLTGFVRKRESVVADVPMDEVAAFWVFSS